MLKAPDLGEIHACWMMGWNSQNKQRVTRKWRERGFEVPKLCVFLFSRCPIVSVVFLNNFIKKLWWSRKIDWRTIRKPRQKCVQSGQPQFRSENFALATEKTKIIFANGKCVVNESGSLRGCSQSIFCTSWNKLQTEIDTELSYSGSWSRSVVYFQILQSSHTLRLTAYKTDINYFYSSPQIKNLGKWWVFVSLYTMIVS